MYFSSASEEGPLGSVQINGTFSTDSSGYFEWPNLEQNKIYTFAIQKPAGYYPKWVLNVEGSYDWNGTHFKVRHNVTEKQTVPIEVHFSHTELPYVKSSTARLTSVFSNSSAENPRTFMNLNITADIGTTTCIEIYTAEEGHPRPFKIEGATDWSYDSTTDILAVWILHLNNETIDVEWRGAAMGQ